MRTRPGTVWITAAALLAASLACSPTEQPRPTAASASIETPARPATQVATTTPHATETPVPGVPGEGGCAFDAALVADVTVEENAGFPPGTPFLKTWRLENTGTCDWESGTSLVRVSGDPLGGPPEVPVRAAAAGARTLVTVRLVAPSTPGTYRSTWQLQTPGGPPFGAVLEVQIVVQTPIGGTPTATDTPTAEPTAAPTDGPTATLAPLDLRVTDLSITPGVLVVNVPFSVKAALHNDGPQPLSVVVRIEDHLSHTHATCTNMHMVTILHEWTADLAAGQSRLVSSGSTIQVDSAWEHLLCVRIDPDDAIAETDEENNSLGASVLVGNQTAIPLDGANSGSFLDDGTAYPYAQPGDTDDGRRVKGFLSWSLAAIHAGARILEAHVSWNTHCFHGGSAGTCTSNRDPFAGLGDLSILAYHYGTLDAGDYAAFEPGGGILLATYAAPLAAEVDVTAAFGEALAAGYPLQLVTLFAGRETDGNGAFDGVRFEEGDEKNRLVVVHVP